MAEGDNGAGRTLVLGGGGVAGIAWTTGLLAGLADAGQDVSGADLLIGTSAGSNVAAQLGSGLPLEDLYARQADPARQAREIPADVDLERVGAEFAGMLSGARDEHEALARIGAYALAAPTVPEASRRDVIVSRLPSAGWPERRILIVAVDAESGETRVFDRESGVSLIDAVAASSAVPGVWPPVTIGGRRYIDGGARSPDNADLAIGSEQVVIISPLGYDSPLPSPMPLRAVVGHLREGGAQVTVISPDAGSAAAIGVNLLDPGTRTPAARAGRAQGQAGLPANS
jgi:NTE family protein